MAVKMRKTFQVVALVLALLFGAGGLLPAAYAQTNDNDGQGHLPSWFQQIPPYPGVKPLAVDNSVLKGLGIDPEQLHVEGGTTSDSVKTVTDFYRSKLKALGWPEPATSPLISSEAGQQLVYRQGRLIVIITTKNAGTSK